MTGAVAAKRRSLDGVQVVVTRPEAAEGPLTRLLRERGASVLCWPLLRFASPEDLAPLEEALADLVRYHGVVFTSPRAVRAVCERVRQPDGRPWVAAVGRSTERSLQDAGWRVDSVPGTARAESLAQRLTELARPGERVLFPASSIARDELPRRLRQLGVEVHRVTAYETVLNDELDIEACIAALDEDLTPVLTFASPSAIQGLAAKLDAGSFERLVATHPVAVIGPTTKAELERRGVRPAAVAASSNLAGLAEAVAVVATQRKEM